MTTHDLAWKSTTFEEKRELLDRSIKKRDELLRKGETKKAHLQLLSTCHDVIGTARAAVKNLDRPGADPLPLAEWNELYKKAGTYAKESVDLVMKEDRKSWSPSDLEVAGVVLLQLAGKNKSKTYKALTLFQEGAAKATRSKNLGAKILLLAQIIRAHMAMDDFDGTEDAIADLVKHIRKTTDPKIFTRAYRALAEGSKFLAIEIAKQSGLKNQELKARNI